jgi:hypothetical protein
VSYGFDMLSTVRPNPFLTLARGQTSIFKRGNDAMLTAYAECLNANVSLDDV